MRTTLLKWMSALFAVMVCASVNATVYNGNCGASGGSEPTDAVQWSFDTNTGTLTFTGTGTIWLAYPLTEGMTLDAAFAGFAVNGDAISSQTKSAKVQRSRWTGQLVNDGLVPGKGYKYTSGVATERTLVFPSSAK